MAPKKENTDGPRLGPTASWGSPAVTWRGPPFSSPSSLLQQTNPYLEGHVTIHRHHLRFLWWSDEQHETCATAFSGEGNNNNKTQQLQRMLNSNTSNRHRRRLQADREILLLKFFGHIEYMTYVAWESNKLLIDSLTHVSGFSPIRHTQRVYLWIVIREDYNHGQFFRRDWKSCLY